MRAEDKAQLEDVAGVMGEVAGQLGLQPPAVSFDVVPAEVMYEIAAYHFPDRFPHWTHGQSYHRQKTGYDHGLQRIYELVVNTEPCHAYLMETNSLTSQKLVIAHVLGHADFFRRNVFFSKSNRFMHTAAAAHAEAINKIEKEHGLEKVEQTLDAALALAMHVDPAREFFRQKSMAEYEEERLRPPDEPTMDYDDIWFMQGKPRKTPDRRRKIPPEPERDLLRFLGESSSILDEWQRDVLAMVGEEYRYFYPNMRTKIMNEGYAAFWHERIMEHPNTRLSPDELIEFQQMHSSVISQGHTFALNPYGVGYKVWKDIEKRWEEPEEEKTWYGESTKRAGGEGLKKVFEVAADYRDSEFLRLFLTEPLVEELDLYEYKFEGDKQKRQGNWVVQQAPWEELRDGLANHLMGLEVPAIAVVDGDFEGRNELLLSHDAGSDLVPLDFDYARRTLGLIHSLWGKPVHLDTIKDDKHLRLTCNDGKAVDVKPF